MSEKKYWVLTDIDLTETRRNAFHQRWPSDPDTTARLNKLINDTPTEETAKSRISGLAIAITCLLALVFGIALWIGSGAR